MEEKINSEHFLVVQVPGESSVDFSGMVVQGLSPFQLFSLAKYLEVVAVDQLQTAMRVARMQQPGIQKPEARIYKPGE